jgi:peroxiredoxin
VQVQEQLPEFDRLGAKIVVISFVAPVRLRQHLSSGRWSIRMLADPDRKAYQAFGLERATWSQLLRPRAMVVYLKLMLRSRLPRRPQEDIHQLGGDFIFDASGRIAYEYRSEDPSDRPDPAELLRVIAECATESNRETT